MQKYENIKEFINTNLYSDNDDETIIEIMIDIIYRLIECVFHTEYGFKSYALVTECLDPTSIEVYLSNFKQPDNIFMELKQSYPYGEDYDLVMIAEYLEPILELF